MTARRATLAKRVLRVRVALLLLLPRKPPLPSESVAAKPSQVSLRDDTHGGAALAQARNLVQDAALAAVIQQSSDIV